jgi:hypothetical protein
VPLHDHFRPPLAPRRRWESFHANWAGAMADALNADGLPDGYFAEEQVHAGPRVEIDLATFASPPGGGLAVHTYAPPAPALSLPAAFPDEFAVQVFSDDGGARLVAAVELVSPGNKDRPDARRLFAAKLAGYLAAGVSVVVVDVVTTRRGDLTAELLQVLGRAEPSPAGPALSAVAARPLTGPAGDRLDLWAEPLAVGHPLPTVPLWLTADVCVPLDLDATYTAAYDRRRLP